MMSALETTTAGYDKLLAIFAFEFNLCHYSEAFDEIRREQDTAYEASLATDREVAEAAAAAAATAATEAEAASAASAAAAAEREAAERSILDTAAEWTARKVGPASYRSPRHSMTKCAEVLRAKQSMDQSKARISFFFGSSL
jgi:hypothetical protein